MLISNWNKHDKTSMFVFEKKKCPHPSEIGLFLFLTKYIMTVICWKLRVAHIWHKLVIRYLVPGAMFIFDKYWYFICVNVSICLEV